MVKDGNDDDSEDFNDNGNNDNEEDNMVTMMIVRSADPLTWGHGCKGSLDTFPPCHWDYRHRCPHHQHYHTG